MNLRSIKLLFFNKGYYIINCYSFNFLITALSLAIFAIETKLAQNRISGTFTLILTRYFVISLMLDLTMQIMCLLSLSLLISVSFKFVSNRSLPTISYMTSLDMYQIISIVYLASCCVWHSVISVVNKDMAVKTVIDRSVLAAFALFFIVIQIVFAMNIGLGYRKIKKIEQAEAKFVREMHPEVLDVDSDEDDE